MGGMGGKESDESNKLFFTRSLSDDSVIRASTLGI